MLLLFLHVSSIILPLIRLLIDDPKITYSGSDPETPQYQEYFEHIVDLQ